jgi:hypothetical protein
MIDGAVVHVVPEKPCKQDAQAPAAEGDTQFGLVLGGTVVQDCVLHGICVAGFGFPSHSVPFGAGEPITPFTEAVSVHVSVRVCTPPPHDNEHGPYCDATHE